MKLYDIAHSRAGDKGNILNLSLFPYEKKDYSLLQQTVTADVVKEHFKGIIQGEVIRYELPNIHGFNFVCYNSLAGGVTTSLAIDAHGKSMSSALLELELD